MPRTFLSIPRFVLALLFVVFLTACTASSAPNYQQVSPPDLKPGDSIPAPAGKVILTVTGKIGIKNDRNALSLDMSTFEKFGVIEYAITDPWLKLAFRQN